MVRKTKNWKHATKNRKQYGNRNMERYQTPFMVLDTRYLKADEADGKGVA